MLNAPMVKTFYLRFSRSLNRMEEIILVGVLILMAFIPTLEFIGRNVFGWGIPGSLAYLQHLTLWVGFLGAMYAVKKDKHLKIELATKLPASIKPWTQTVTLLLSSFICLGLFEASVLLIIAEAPAVPQGVGSYLPNGIEEILESYGLYENYGTSNIAGWIPIWVAELVMPIGFLGCAIRYVLLAVRSPWIRLLVFVAWLFTPMCAQLDSLSSSVVILCMLLLVLSLFLGLPIFCFLGGTALLLFIAEGVTIAAIPTETYRIVASQIFPTIPLFTLVGFILSEGHANERLVRVFKALFGWMPGGLAVATTMLCAFFTTFTGATGVTILALGGLLLPVLIKGGFKESFSIGLLTSTGSLGLLLPPSLVVILYGVIAHVSILDLFKAGLVPGTLIVLPFCMICVAQGLKSKDSRIPFDFNETVKALWIAKWEISMPVLVLVFIFSGFCTLVEAAALLAAYALCIECLVYRDIGFQKLVKVLLKSATLIGGVLIILGVAMGLTSYLVDAEIPMQAASWVKAHISSKWIFLLILNVALLVVGCLMDIYSALVVVVPLILPMGESFGIDPIHLGIIFLANLQLGYLTPPVGMNLFLSSFRFDKPLTQIARYTFPFLMIMVLVVIMITYIPALSVGMVELLK